MKFIVTILSVFLFFPWNADAHDKITFKNKEAFHQTCDAGKFCSSFDLLNLDDKAGLSKLESHVQDNPTVYEGSIEGTMYHLKVTAENFSRSYYKKFFYQLGLTEIEILEGDSKGIYTIDEFLKLFGL